MGGMERASCNLANLLQSHGCQVFYLAIFRQERFFSLDDGIIFDEPKDEVSSVKLRILPTILRIRKTISRFRPDAVIVFNNFYSAICLCSLYGLGQRIYISDRASPLYAWPKKIRLFNKAIFRLIPPAGVIAQTFVAAKYQRKLFRREIPICVIHNPIKSPRQIISEKKNHILAVGRLSDPLKGFDRLIRAFSMVRAENWKLIFAGGNPLQEGREIYELARSMEVHDKVVFLGKVEDMERVYSESKIFVIPSRSEGFPNALCEAMAAGLPCVSFDFVAGPNEIIVNNENGLLVPNHSVAALASAIQYLVDSELDRLRIGNNAKSIIEKLNFDAIGKQYLKFIFPTE
jgi:glycosyltransferase involved in cell wall biosynthesis